jgi:hypothetical protein
MKLSLLSYLLVCFALVVKSQDYNSYTSGNKALYIPETETYSTTSIANYLQSNFKTDKEKLLAAYFWVTANIRYDRDSMYNINWGPDPQTKISSALRRRKGVCENFAAIFSDISSKCGIPSFVVTGYTMQSGAVKRTGHTWCAVYPDKEWLLCDPTWDAGPGSRTNFFLISPREFIESHMPFDPLWQLLPYQLSHREFSRGNIYAKKESAPMNVTDSVKAFLQLDSLHQLEASLLRMKQAGLENDMVNTWRSYVNMKIAIVYEDKDMNLYNSAVADLNRANTIFNNFVEYRNNRFIPTKPDDETRALLDPIAGIISSAEKKLDQIGRSVENLQYDTGPLQKRLDALALRVKEQQLFLKQYVESSLADRGKLFYK